MFNGFLGPLTILSLFNGYLLKIAFKYKKILKLLSC